MPLLAGDHILEIVATTTLGKTTSRICQVIVRPVEGDPELASDAKSRWLTIGTTKTIKCKNVTSVSKVFIGKQEATNVSFANQQSIVRFRLKDKSNDYSDLYATGFSMSINGETFTAIPSSATNVFYLAIPGRTLDMRQKSGKFWGFVV